MAYLSVEQETSRIARNVELCNALLRTSATAATVRLAADAKLLQTKQSAARIIPFYESVSSIRANMIAGIADIESRYKAAGGTGDPALPVGAPTESSGDVFAPVLGAASDVPGWVWAAGLVGVGYFFFARK